MRCRFVLWISTRLSHLDPSFACTEQCSENQGALANVQVKKTIFFLPLLRMDCTMQTSDSHWFLFSESPMNMSRFPLILSMNLPASNLIESIHDSPTKHDRGRKGREEMGDLGAALTIDKVGGAGVAAGGGGDDAGLVIGEHGREHPDPRMGDEQAQAPVGGWRSRSWGGRAPTG
ncbi:hypothetical protein ZWY2020_041520 [Hordeum vulgare]|nr:hypothetical protein ZWY2020_041520 [Hordeum vulgare]